MRAYLTAMVLTASLCSCPALAQQPPTARIAGLIAALDSERFIERERATRALLALEGAALDPLRSALANAPSVEFTRRAQAILDQLAIHEPGGDIVNGLKVRLTADCLQVKPGDTVKLTTTLCNMTDKPLNVLVGYTTCGNYFECGSAISRLDRVPGKPSVDVEPKLAIGGFCGTGAGPMYVTIAPKSVVKFETPAILAEKHNVYTLGTQKYFTIDATTGADLLRMGLSVGTNDNVPRPVRPGLKGEGIRPTDETAPFWSGVVRSNDVRLQITR